MVLTGVELLFRETGPLCRVTKCLGYLRTSLGRLLLLLIIIIVVIIIIILFFETEFCSYCLGWSAGVRS